MRRISPMRPALPFAVLMVALSLNAWGRGGGGGHSGGHHGGGHHAPSANDMRSNAMNPNNAAYEAAADNRSNQMNPNNDAYWSARGGSDDSDVDVTCGSTQPEDAAAPATLDGDDAPAPSRLQAASHATIPSVHVGTFAEEGTSRSSLPGWLAKGVAGVVGVLVLAWLALAGFVRARRAF